jgi:hypothetical protein
VGSRRSEGEVEVTSGLDDTEYKQGPEHTFTIKAKHKQHGCTSAGGWVQFSTVERSDGGEHSAANSD